MGTMCVPSKTLWPTLKGCKWGYLVFHWRRLEPRASPRQKNSKCNSVSFVMRISGSLLHRHLKEITCDILFKSSIKQISKLTCISINGSSPRDNSLSLDNSEPLSPISFSFSLSSSSSLLSLRSLTTEKCANVKCCISY